MPVTDLAGADQGPPESWVIENEQFAEPLEPGTPIEILNQLGDVRVRGTNAPGERNVSVFAVIQKATGGEPGPRIDIRHEGTMTIRASRGGPEEIPGDARARVDLAVIVPPGSSLHVRTTAGLIEIKGVADDVHARSDSGEIRLVTSGFVEASSEVGEISALLQGHDWPGDPTFETEHGDISIRFPPRMLASVEATTRGRIATEYSLRVDRDRYSPRKVARADVGGLEGDAREGEKTAPRKKIAIRSTTGDIELLGPFPEMKRP